MSDIILNAYKKFEDVKAKNIQDIIEIDKEVRKYVTKL
jgi:1-deoxy-D-xylulose-5-phosphate reductoisomerase